MKNIQITNREFLHAIFGEHFIWAHVTDFFHDPSADFSLESKRAWMGNYFVNSELHQYANQYFCISLFKELLDQHPRRRKELFDAAYCFVIDDVGEKIDINLMIGMPTPSWILSTSPGSQQWGYILDTPCTNREKVEKLLKGLVLKFCPNGIDSGMLGVTRYVRLPEGYNTKKSKVKLNQNKIYKCELLLWEPNNKYDIDQYADAFNIDLTKITYEKIYNDCEGYNESFFMNHPIWDVIDFKEMIAFNKFIIECPWKNEHTSQADSGTMLFIKQNGKLGFKCHHGHCSERNGKDLVEYVDSIDINWNDIYIEYCKILSKEQAVKPCPIIIKNK